MINQIIKDWVGEEKIFDPETNKDPLEFDGYNQALQDLKSRIPQLTERIVKMIENEKEELKHQSMLMGDDVGYEKAIDHIITTLKEGKE